MRVNPAVCFPQRSLERWTEFRRSSVAGYLATARSNGTLHREPSAAGLYYIGGTDERSADMVIDTRIGAYSHPAKRI